jgi:hypothetical protein
VSVAARIRPVGRVDAAVVRVRAWIDAKLPWYDEKAAARQHRTIMRVVANAERVMDADRTEIMRGSYQRAGRRLGG